MTITQAVALITKEREHQDATWGGITHDQQFEFNDWMGLIAKHAGRAAFTPIGSGDHCHAMVVVAALAIASLQFCDVPDED